VSRNWRNSWKTKSWKSQNGTAHAGRAFPTSLRRLLTQRVYAGQVNIRGALYAGEQAAIVEPSVWQEVNTELAQVAAPDGTIHAPQNALLAGRLLCKSCQRPMVPTYTAKPGGDIAITCASSPAERMSSCPTKSCQRE